MKRESKKIKDLEILKKKERRGEGGLKCNV